LEKSLLLFVVFFCISTGKGLAQKIWVHQNQDLEFGQFIIDQGSSAQLKISADGQRKALSGIYLMPGNFHPAAFTISTDSHTPIKIKVESESRGMINGAGENIILTPETSFTEYWVIQQGFPVQVYIGGTLDILDSQVTGNFSADIVIKVSLYND